MDKENKNTPELVVTLFLLCLISILVSFNRFYINKDYDFYVETTCNPAEKTCYFRDCETAPDSCPPNGLSNYSLYTISANDFERCENEDCAPVCTTEPGVCEEIECSEENGDECTLGE